MREHRDVPVKMNRILVVCVHHLHVVSGNYEWTHSSWSVTIPYVYKAKNTLSPYVERTDTLIKVLPLSQGFGPIKQ